MKLAFVLLLITLGGCAPALPKGFYCWQDRGYLVCQIIPAENQPPESR